MKAVKTKNPQIKPNRIEKAQSGIEGLDEITFGGLPKGRSTLICGNAGCGKTLFAMEFLVKGAAKHQDPGLFIAFEETENDLQQNVLSLGFNLDSLKKKKLLRLEHVRVNKDDIFETGEYNLDGLFVRLEKAIDSIGAKRVVLDTLESLFSGFENEAIIRAELRRLFSWLKEKKVTTVITAERGADNLTKQGLEEYVTDCVILLDHRVINQISTRRLRIVKYRGSVHGTNEYPFLIDETGISILPITSMQLHHKASTERVSSGIPSLDDMLGGKGFFKGSTILVSGAAGTGKSSIASYFAYAACQRNERCIYFAFEESQSQIIRNMRSIGIDYTSCIKKEQIIIHSARPNLFGLEMHLVTMHKKIMEFKPSIVIIDPVSNLINIGEKHEVGAMLTRLIDFLKSQGITALFTALLHGNESEPMDERISSLVDTWLLVRELETNGERNRGIYVLKSRGMAHSNQVREFIINNTGLHLIEPYIAKDGILVGTAKTMYEVEMHNEAELIEIESTRKFSELNIKRRIMESKIQALQANYEAERNSLEKEIAQKKKRLDSVKKQKENIKRLRTNVINDLRGINS